MSRLITLPDGRQVTGCKNYVRTPKPGLMIDQRVEVGLGLDADALQDGAPLSLYIKGETTNTVTPLRLWVSAADMEVVDIAPDQFKQGYRLDMAKTGTYGCTAIFNTAGGWYKLWHFAVMLHDEMDESHVIQKFNQYYP